VRVLEDLCDPARFIASARHVLAELAGVVDCEAAAIRVRDGRGDYPYLVHQGFGEEFASRENLLCHRGPQGRPEWDQQGRMVLDCLCGAVLRGDPAAGSPCFTPAGSFYTNAASELVSCAQLSDARLRGTCMACGFESIALVPLRDGREVVGLLQFNDRRRGRFDEELINFIEKAGGRMGVAVRSARQLGDLAAARREVDEQRLGREQLVMFEEMTSGMVHDIKNPLAGMSLCVSRLRKVLKEDLKLGPIVEHLSAAMQTLNDTVTKATDWRRGPQLDPEPVNPNLLMEEAVRVVLPRAELQDVRVMFDLAEKLPPVLADRILLKRAFVNLLANALDAMPSSGKLRLQSRLADGGMVEMIVADSGPGIDPRQAGKLFKPFQSSKPGGAGLGLSIVRRIAELHSGDISLRGGADGGTEAVLSMPAAVGACVKAELP
jgi:signal transduction histidine kinase